MNRCDDGNLINGDGCSNLCDIESGFICFGGSNHHKDICLPTPNSFGSSPDPYGRELGVGRVLVWFNEPMIITKNPEKYTSIEIIDVYGYNIVQWYTFTYIGRRTLDLIGYDGYVVDYRCNMTFTKTKRV